MSVSNERAAEAETVATRAVGYIRVSTEEQAANGYGLNVQARAIRSFAQSQGYTFVDVIADAGVSGAKRPEDRPGFQRVIELAKDRAFSILLVWKFDRLARNLLFSVITVHELKERYGIVLRSVTEPIDTGTPMGGMIFAILASFAAEERRVITGRTLAGKKEKASRGGFAGGAAPLGYKRDLQGGLMIHDAEAAIVRQSQSGVRRDIPSDQSQPYLTTRVACPSVVNGFTRARSATFSTIQNIVD